MSLELFREFKESITSEGVALSPKQVAKLFEVEASLMEEREAWELMEKENKELDKSLTKTRKALEDANETNAALEEKLEQLKPFVEQYNTPPQNLLDEQRRELVEMLFCDLTLAELEEIKMYYLKR